MASVEHNWITIVTDGFTTISKCTNCSTILRQEVGEPDGYQLPGESKWGGEPPLCEHVIVLASEKASHLKKLIEEGFSPEDIEFYSDRLPERWVYGARVKPKDTSAPSAGTPSSGSPSADVPAGKPSPVESAPKSGPSASPVPRRAAPNAKPRPKSES